MNAHVVDRKRLDLRDDPNLLSPPWVQDPLYQCATAVVVHGYVATADIEVQVNGASVPIVNGGFPFPNGVTVPVPALTATQKVRARQIKGSVKSDWSQEITLGDHTQDFPAGPPRPEINPAPVAFRFVPFWPRALVGQAKLEVGTGGSAPGPAREPPGSRTREPP
jgi:hypothetical protein